MKKERLDLLLVARGFAASRERAKRLIMAGQVLVDEQRVDKAGTTVSPLSSLRVVGEDLPYVSRGGLKLAKGLESFGTVLTGKIAADIAASTGGFTDCMLQNGAAKVYAIDVGYGQLDWKLRTDTRVVNMERTNIRNVTAETLGQLLDFASIDVAFISLDKVLPVVRILLKDDGETIALIRACRQERRRTRSDSAYVRYSCGPYCGRGSRIYCLRSYVLTDQGAKGEHRISSASDDGRGPQCGIR